MDELAFAKRLVERGGAAALAHFRTGTAVQNKLQDGGFDPVTAGDREAEIAMRAAIEETFPDHGIFGEEFGIAHPDASKRWILDPVDGTRSFMIGMPTWGTLAGLLDGENALVGAMAQPFSGDVFWGGKSGAWLENGATVTKLSTSTTNRLSDAVLSTTSPFLFDQDHRDRYFELEAQCKMARYGGDCYAFALLAAGYIDVVVDGGLQIYDIAALIPIIEGAGGIVTTWSGENATKAGDVIAAANATLYEEAMAVIRA